MFCMSKYAAQLLMCNHLFQRCHKECKMLTSIQVEWRKFCQVVSEDIYRFAWQFVSQIDEMKEMC